MSRPDLSDHLASGGDLAAVLDDAAPIDPPGAGLVDPPEVDQIYVQGRQTLRALSGRAQVVAPYVLSVTEEVTTQRGKVLYAQIEAPGAAPIPLHFPAEVLGDGRALRKLLAGAMGAAFSSPRGRIDDIISAWLAASTPARRVHSLDFGFSAAGDAFIDATGTLGASGPATAVFRPPEGSAAAGLSLGPAAPAEVPGLITELWTVWPEVLGAPAITSALLGLVGWALIAPVMEARDPAVAPLLGFLYGPSGVGKSTHAGIVQGFFGRWGGRCALSFGSTALSIEQEGFSFRGAAMTVGDVKAGVVGEGGASRVLGMLQRAGDRAERRRLDPTGGVLSSRCRATCLFEGEDVPTQEGSALARLLLLALPQSARAPQRLAQLQRLLPRLPILTRALVDHLLAARPWAELHRSYVRYVELNGRDQPTANAVRVARSLAAILVGLEVWRRIGAPDLQPEQELLRDLLGPALSQLSEVAEARPGQRFLDLLRQLLASNLVGLGNMAECVGVDCKERGIVYLLPEFALSRVLRHFPAEALPPARSILDDLHRAGSIAEHDANRRTKKARVNGNAVNTWALRRADLYPGDTAGTEAPDRPDP